MSFAWLQGTRIKGLDQKPTAFLWECDCGKGLTFEVEKVKEMKVGESVNCPGSFYGTCNKSVNASELKKFIGYGPAVAYGKSNG